MNKLKHVSLLSFFFFFSLKGECQINSFGVFAGPVLNAESMAIKSTNIIAGLATGFQGGLFYERKLSDRFNVRTDLGYAHKNLLYSYSGYTSGDSSIFGMNSWGLNYLILRILPGWRFYHRFRVSAGPYAGLLLKGHYEENNEFIYQNQVALIKYFASDAQTGYSTWDYGFDIGLSYHFTQKLMLDIAWEHGLYARGVYSTNVFTHHTYNESCMLTLSYAY